MVKRENGPIDPWLRLEAIPSVWCPGCGIGIVVNTFLQTMKKMEISADSIRLVSSGLSCTGKVADYLNISRIDSGDQDVFLAAREEKEQNPDALVVTFANDNDLLARGIDGLVETIRSGANILAIFINSFVYNIFIEHRKFFNSPFVRSSADLNSESPFNMPKLADRHGASYIARWTPLHCRRLSFSIRDAATRPGMSFIEVISPCLMYFASERGPGFSLDRMQVYCRNAVVKNLEPTENLDTRETNTIVIGKFIDRESA